MNEVKDKPQGACDTESLNCLLRCQLAGVETYDRAMEKLEDQHILADLHRIREEHARAAALLVEKVLQFGGTPIEWAEPWSAFTAAASNGGTAIGPATVLSALRQGEEHIINEDEDSLKHEDVNAECKNLIRTELLPNGRNHVAELNRLMGGM